MCVQTSPSRWLIQSLIVVVVLAGASYSQTAPTVPNISGNWELIEFDGNRDKSHPKFPKMTLIIEQTSDQLKITEKRIKQGKEEVRTFVYHTDRQGDTNTSRVELWRTASPKFESVTRIDKNRIVTEFKRELTLMADTRRTSDGALDLVSDSSRQRTDEWSLDESGKTLTLKTHVIDIQSPNPRTDFINSKWKFRRI